MKKFAVWMLFLMMVGYMAFSCAIAEDDGVRLQLLDTQPLCFSKQPVGINSIVMLPDDTVAFIYMTEKIDDDTMECCLELFAADGTPLLSETLGSFSWMESSPHAQIILQNDRFLCEYYPDITTMEQCFRTTYRYDGRTTGKRKQQRLQFGTASYAEHVGDYMVRKQAHSVDEPDASVLREVEITHVPTGEKLTIHLYDWQFCSFADDAGHLFIAQKNEQGNLEIRRYTAAETLQETITKLDSDCFANQDDAYVLSAACMDGTAYLQVRQTNRESLILTCDLERGAVTANHTLLAAEGSNSIAAIRSAGSVLLAVDGVWNEGIQRYCFHLDAIDETGTRTPLQLMNACCLDVLSGEDESAVLTIEMDSTAASYALCRYLIIAH